VGVFFPVRLLHWPILNKLNALEAEILKVIHMIAKIVDNLLAE
jgi:hypothetical protein